MTNRKMWKLFLVLGAILALIASACGDDDDDAEASTDTEAVADTGATDTTVAGSTDETTADSEGGEAEAPSGDPIPVGILHSLSGTMSISEVAVRDAELLAINEINAAGGVLGRPIEPIVEDGASDWPTFAEKAEKLLTVDEVAVVFGGWTSASRKAMLPVFEGLNGLLFYPVQYEGLEASPNIFYTGATTNQQIIPALDYIVEQGWTTVYLVGSDYVFPRTANQIITSYAESHGLEIVGEDYLPLGETDVATIVGSVIDAAPDVVFNTLNGDSNVAFFSELTARGSTAEDIPTISVSVAEEEVTGIGVENIVNHLVAWNYYMTTDLPRNTEFVAAFQAEFGAERVTADPIEAGYNAVYIWAAAVEAAGTTDVDAVRTAAAGLVLDTPEGELTVHEWNQHVFKTARIGIINAEGQIDEVWASDGPIEPDPCLESYDWAADLNQGQCESPFRPS
jgi:urea transport system substrate-binding protein